MVNTEPDCLTDSLTNTITNQLSKNHSNQLYAKHVKNKAINNRFTIYR